MKNRVYMVIDLKSFYASVECVERRLDPMQAKLVVADITRTEKTICLAVSPALKKLGIPGRCRLFEIPKNLDFIIAPPQMQKYIDVSADIYGIYLKYISKDDIHVYSIDEVFMDVTDYLHMYKMKPKELAITIMNDVYETTGITATCGIGTNLYLAKIALDIVSKHVDSHIGILDENRFKKYLWDYEPLTDFWRIGNGTARRLSKMGITTMRGIAGCDEDKLYKAFGIDAELMIDHAYGKETTTMEDIKNYKSKSTSIGSGQVLSDNADFATGKIIIKEMADLLVLDLVDKGLVTDSITIHASYDRKLNKKAAHGTIRLPKPSNSAKLIMHKTEELYDEIMDRTAPIRRFYINFNNTVDESCYQYSFFTDMEEEEKERDLQKALIKLKNRFGKNTIFKGMDMQDGATTMERNSQIGGHRSGK